jgi:hypothetical protein
MTSNADNEIKVPTFLTGIVSKDTGVDFCMDGAVFRLHTMAGILRIKPSNAETTRNLERYAGTRLRVTVGGYPVVGPECQYVAVYYAQPAEDLLKKLGLTF